MRITIGGLYILFAAALAMGQISTSRVLGVVQDPSGAAVTNAQVQITNEGTRVTFKTATSSSGTYAFEAVQPGDYTVTVEAAGFRKFSSKGNAVTIGQPATVNVTLEIGTVAESIDVAAVTEAVQTSTSGNFGNILAQAQIADAPIVGTRGRNPLGLIDIQPGVIDTPSVTGGSVVVFGARDRAWNYTLDGVDVNENSAPGSDFSPVRTNPDSLTEFRVITSNATAEYGETSGGQVTMVTRSGSNEFHGDAFEFYRTPRFNANEWQNNFNNLGQRQFVQHIYGGGVGGPVWRNHTFFFVNTQFLRTHETASTTRTVFTQQARQGVLRYVSGGRTGNAGSAFPAVDRSGNVLPGVNVQTYDVVSNDPQHLGLDKTIQGLVNAAPMPNRFDVGDGLNTAGFNFTAVQFERQHDVTFKIDQIINSKNTFYARVYLGEQDTNCDRVNGGSEIFPGTGCVVNTLRSPRNLAFNWRWNPTGHLTNEMVVGNNKFTFNFYQPNGDLNKISFLGYSTDPVDTTANYLIANLRTLNTWQFVDNVGYQLGAHSLKFGTNLRFTSHNDIRGSIAGLNSVEWVTFNADFDPVAFNIPAGLNKTFDLPSIQLDTNFLLGRVGEIDRGLLANGNAFGPGVLNFNAHYNAYEFYAQDTWKLRKNLTLDLGVRLEMDPSPTADNNLLSRPNVPLVAGALPTDTATWTTGSMYPDRMNNIGPAIGIAWDPFSTGKTSVRANYRLAYDRINTFVLSSVIYPNLPGLTYPITDVAFGQNGGRLAQVPLYTTAPAKPSDLKTPPAYSNASVFSVDPNLRVPTTHEWQFDLQREVSRNMVVQATYIGRHAYHLFGSYNANQVNEFASGLQDAFSIVKAGGQSALINQIFRADNRIAANETASDMIRRVFSSQLSLNSFAAIGAAEATRIQGSGLNAKSVVALSGANPFLLIPYPQFGGGANVIDSNDYSTYHGLVIQVQKRMSRGITAGLAYTLAKSLGTRSYDPTFTRYTTGVSQSATSTPYDNYNRRLNYGEAEYDHRHAIQGNWTAELPFGHGKRFLSGVNSWLERLVGGWEVSGFFNYYSGRPLTIYSGAFTFYNAVDSFANCNGCSHSLGQVGDLNGIKYYFKPNQAAQFTAPAAGQLGNTGKGFLFGPRYFDVDAALLKRIKVRERMNVELRADATNLTNTPSFGLPTATITSPVFGQIRDNVESGSRKIQVGAKFNF